LYRRWCSHASSNRADLKADESWLVDTAVRSLMMLRECKKDGKRVQAWIYTHSVQGTSGAALSLCKTSAQLKTLSAGRNVTFRVSSDDLREWWHVKFEGDIRDF
jgi:hypothetical protein